MFIIRKWKVVIGELTWCCPKDFLIQRITLPRARWRKDFPPRDVLAVVSDGTGWGGWLPVVVKFMPARSFISDNWAPVSQGREED